MKNNFDLQELNDREFCDFLEDEICRYFENNYDQNTKGFWCDGVIFDWADKEGAYFRIFLGKKGETEYNLTLIIGEKTSTKTSISINESKVNIDLYKKKITIEFE